MQQMPALLPAFDSFVPPRPDLDQAVSFAIGSPVCRHKETIIFADFAPRSQVEILPDSFERFRISAAGAAKQTDDCSVLGRRRDWLPVSHVPFTFNPSSTRRRALSNIAAAKLSR